MRYHSNQMQRMPSLKVRGLRIRCRNLLEVFSHPAAAHLSQAWKCGACQLFPLWFDAEWRIARTCSWLRYPSAPLTQYSSVQSA